MEQNRELWSEYRRTWKAFVTALDAWERCADVPGTEGSEMGLSEKERLREAAEGARSAHKTARDRLAEHLTSREHRVRNTAKMIWELSGKPEGTAEADWFRAEKVWK